MQLHIGSELPAMFIYTASGSLSAIHADKEVKEAADYFFFCPDEEVQSGPLD